MRTTTKAKLRLYFFIFLLCCFNSNLLAQARIYITDGICDATKINSDEDIIALNGHWNFFSGQLITALPAGKQNRPTLLVPSIWNDHSEDNSGSGFGTYALQIIVSAPEVWALEIPQLYNNYNLYVDGTLVAATGKTGPGKDHSAPQWKPQVVTFSTDRDTISVLLQMSNFHHHTGGIREQILFGKASLLESHFNKGYYSVLFEVALLVVLSLFFLAFTRSKGKIPLYFALLCIGWAIREMFSDLYPISTLFPSISWNFLIRVEYISLFLIMICSTLLVNKVFAEIGNKAFLILMVVVNILFINFTLFTPPTLFTRWLPLYLVTALIILVYSAVLLLRALIEDRTGAWFLIIGLIFAILLMGYDLISYRGILQSNVMISSIGYCIVYLLVSIGLMQYLNILKSSKASSNKLTYKDLYH